MENKTLVLTPWMTPHRIVSWKDAVTMMFNGKVRVLEEYDEVCGRIEIDRLDDFMSVVDSIPYRPGDDGDDLEIRVPAVVSLHKAVHSVKRGIRFSRINVFTRDKFTCQYCGEKFTVKSLNYDHVIPKSQGGKTSWDNIVTSCYDCNELKGNKAPDRNGIIRVTKNGEKIVMRLLRKPEKPSSLPTSYLHVDPGNCPDVWKNYCIIPGSDEPEIPGEN